MQDDKMTKQNNTNGLKEFEYWIYGFMIVAVFLMFCYQFFPDDTGNCFSDCRGGWFPSLKNDESWITINIVGLSAERMVEVCQHEVGHELYYRKYGNYSFNDTEEFASICEKNWTKCLEKAYIVTSATLLKGGI